MSPTEAVQQKLELLVLQPTSYCNLNCSYCYLANRRVQHLMSLEVVDNTFRKVLQSNLADPNLIVLWHAGEPLAAGLQFFEYASERIARYRPATMHVRQSLQTNGTLLTDDWCRFLRREGFEVGVSIDGPQFVHDAHRRNWSGHGSYARAMAGVAKLREHEIEFGVLAVLTTDSIGHADELYDFFKNLGATSVGFNVEEIEHEHLRSTYSMGNEPALRDMYGRFFHRLLERVDSDPDPLKIREIEQLLKITVRIRHDAEYVFQPMEVAPLRVLTVLHNGDVSPFSPEFAGMQSPLYDNFRIGNITTDTLDDIATALMSSQLRTDVDASRELCRSSCSYFQFCGGGYLSNKWSERGTLLVSDTQACRFHSQTVADTYLRYMEI